MAKWCICYSSSSGNTRKLAEVAKEILDADLISVNELLASDNYSTIPVELEAKQKSLSISAESILSEIELRLSQYDCIMMGYWLKRGSPDPKAALILSRIFDKKVALFQTHGAYVHSDHAVTAFARAALLLNPNNKILGTFSSQGAVNPGLIKLRLEGKIPGHKGENLEDCKKRWADAATHPDEQDLERMRNFAKKMKIIAELRINVK